QQEQEEATRPNRTAHTVPKQFLTTTIQKLLSAHAAFQSVRNPAILYQIEGKIDRPARWPTTLAERRCSALVVFVRRVRSEKTEGVSFGVQADPIRRRGLGKAGEGVDAAHVGDDEARAAALPEIRDGDLES